MKPVINGSACAYHTYGNPLKQAVVFIHGFPFSQEMWHPQIEALKYNYHVITYDVRGHGNSEIGDGQYTIELFVDDLLALLEYLKVENSVLVGLSMGGYIALRAIERAQKRFCALVLCDTRSEADANETKIKRFQQIQVIKAKGISSFAEGFLKAVFYEKTFQNNPTAIETIRTIIHSNSPAGMTGTLIALASRTDSTPSLRQIKIPTLLLVGEHDAVTPTYASITMKEQIKGAEIHRIPEAGHMSNLENAGEFNKRLLSFLGKL